VNQNYATSRAYSERAHQSLAGGVSSNVRADAAAPPLYFERAEGAYLYDVDGNAFLDYTLGQGPMLLGHSPQPVLDYVTQAMQSGQLYAGQHKLEIELAERIQAHVPCAELVRFSSSGSEAVHTALRLARAATGREKHIKFEGHYHGWLDDQLISVHPPLEQAGPAQTPQAVPASAGQATGSMENVIVLPWNNPEALRSVLEAQGDEIASIIMEPIMCNTGCILPEPGYLEAVRALCDQHGIVLIFDEVITGFRLGLGGAQTFLQVVPDLATFGKALANGFPMSCLAGKRALMEHIASLRVNHSGTYNTNVMVTAAAYATIRQLETTEQQTYPHLFELGQALMAGISRLSVELEVPLLLQGPGPMFHMAFTDLRRITDYRTFLQTDRAQYNRFALALLDHGVRVLARGLWYVSAAHTMAHVHHTLKVVRQALEQTQDTA
jgi:glutamate-1-semialdehyde 2,1-aminomutase